MWGNWLLKLQFCPVMLLFVKTVWDVIMESIEALIWFPALKNYSTENRNGNSNNVLSLQPGREVSQFIYSCLHVCRMYWRKGIDVLRRYLVRVCKGGREFSVASGILFYSLSLALAHYQIPAKCYSFWLWPLSQPDHDTIWPAVVNGDSCKGELLGRLWILNILNGNPHL